MAAGAARKPVTRRRSVPGWRRMRLIGRTESGGAASSSGRRGEDSAHDGGPEVNGGAEGSGGTNSVENGSK
jgi:hypothetical protein